MTHLQIAVPRAAAQQWATSVSADPTDCLVAKLPKQRRKATMTALQLESLIELRNGGVALHDLVCAQNDGRGKGGGAVRNQFVMLLMFFLLWCTNPVMAV